ncbi:MAG: hypothetical protein ACOY3K_03210 [Candidatus Omnitrophota bacterium]
MKTHAHKITAALTAFLFIFSLFPASFAQAPGVEASSSLTAASQQASAISLQLPENIGKVDLALPGTGPSIIHIQTAHGSYEAGKNIARMLHYLDKNYGFKDLFVEGAYGDLHPEALRFFPKDMKKTLRVADELLKRGYLEGEELYLAATPDARIYGIEDEKTYKANEQALVEVLRREELSRKYLDQMDEAIKRIASRYLDKRVRDFLYTWRDFELGKASLTEWTRMLYVYAKRCGWDLLDPGYQLELPMLVRLYNIQEMAKGFDVEKFGVEKERFVKAVSAQFLRDRSNEQNRPVPELPTSGTVLGTNPENSKNRPLASDQQPAASDLLDAIELLLNDSTSKTPLSAEEAEGIAEAMVGALPEDFPYDDFPLIKKYIGQTLLQKEVMGTPLMEETVKVREAILERMVRGDIEKQTTALMKDYFLLKKLFALKLTKSEYDNMQYDSTQYGSAQYAVCSKSKSDSAIPPYCHPAILPSSIASRFTELNSAGRVRNVQFQHLEDIDSLFEKAMEFYRLAHKRDALMLEKLDTQMKTRGVEKAVVITGGFHADAFRDHFETLKESYALLTPRLTSFDENSFETYVKTMFRQAESTDAASRGTVKPNQGNANPVALRAEALRIAVRLPIETNRVIPNPPRRVRNLQPSTIDFAEALPTIEGRAELRSLQTRRFFFGRAVKTALAAAAASAIPEAVQAVLNAAANITKEPMTPEIETEVKGLLDLLEGKVKDTKLELKDLARLGELESKYQFDLLLRNRFASRFKSATSKILDATLTSIKLNPMILSDNEFSKSLSLIISSQNVPPHEKQKIIDLIFQMLQTQKNSDSTKAIIKFILATKDISLLSRLTNSLDVLNWFSSVRSTIIGQLSMEYRNNGLDEAQRSFVQINLTPGGKIYAGTLLILCFDKKTSENELRFHRQMIIDAMGRFEKLSAALLLIEALKNIKDSLAFGNILRKIEEISSSLSNEDKKQVIESIGKLSIREKEFNKAIEALKIKLSQNVSSPRAEVRNNIDVSRNSGLRNGKAEIFRNGIALYFLTNKEAPLLDSLASADIPIKSIEDALLKTWLGSTFIPPANAKLETQPFTAIETKSALAVLNVIQNLAVTISIRFEGFEAIFAQVATENEKILAVFEVLDLMLKIRALSGNKIQFEVVPDTYAKIEPLLTQTWETLQAQNPQTVPGIASNIINAFPNAFSEQPDFAVTLTPGYANAREVIDLATDANRQPVVFVGKSARYPAETMVTSVAALLSQAVVEGLAKRGKISQLSPAFVGFTRAFSLYVDRAFAQQQFTTAA